MCKVYIVHQHSVIVGNIFLIEQLRLHIAFDPYWMLDLNYTYKNNICANLM